MTWTVLYFVAVGFLEGTTRYAFGRTSTRVMPHGRTQRGEHGGLVKIAKCRPTPPVGEDIVRGRRRAHEVRVSWEIRTQVLSISLLVRPPGGEV